VNVSGQSSRPVAELVVQHDARFGHRPSDLQLEMFARYDHEDRIDGSIGKHGVRESSRETRFPRARGCDDERIRRTLRIPSRECVTLPHP
jgi:hypothetical protein